MDLITVILFLILYYLRPQEWSTAFAQIHFVQIIMLSGLATLFFRDKKIGLKEFFRTPHDWAVFAFWLWIILTATHPWDTFKDNANLYIFYIVIVQVLYSVRRMKIFLGWWTFLIVTVALLALASKWGYDPLESLEITNGPMKGRLILNLSIFNNPNALGHSLVPAIPMLFYYMIWKRPIVWRIFGVALLLIPLYAIYLTISKGTFLSAGITVIATLAFGRPKSMQIAIVSLSLVFGVGALYALPRMNELSKAKSDEAIQGRVAAFRHGYELLQTTSKGVGKGEWGKDPFITDYIPVLLPPKMGDNTGKGHYTLRAVHYSKAPHSSYVCTGGELGKPGLFLFVAVLYCCLRTTTTARTQTPDEERIRRMLFVLVVSYVVSSWMVDFEYRPTFFMFTAAIAALHRHLMGILTEKEGPEEEKVPSLEPQVPVWRTPQLFPQPALAGAVQKAVRLHEAVLNEPHREDAAATEPAQTVVARIAGGWNRLRLFDGVAIFFLTWGVIRFWAYIMVQM